MGRPRDSLLTVDRRFKNDLQKVGFISKDIFDNLMRREKAQRLPFNFMQDQNQVDRKLRAFVVDLIIALSNKLVLRNETLFLTIYLLDFVLFKFKMEKSGLVGYMITCLFISMKYEEINIYELQNILSYMNSVQFNFEQFLKAEQLVLSLLDYQLTIVLPLDYLNRIGLVFQESSQNVILAHFFLNISLYSANYNCYLPSEKAIASFYLMKKQTAQQFNSQRMQKYLIFDSNKVVEFCKIIIQTL